MGGHKSVGVLEGGGGIQQLVARDGGSAERGGGGGGGTDRGAVRGSGGAKEAA
eukprot:CAMPEP_0119478720 /NCGR_PEP_ID=MMETSP1344-20130328/8327_1 /TAXON_ID=236787 /ORGANISM="Florenciella parvula, Strain CCMP2471" /LENGTH=52 /DNA_ID=CAMNT_0007512911 /DNA_START=488 /DNA_END=647 /DNA_ORIENTATION=-